MNEHEHGFYVGFCICKYCGSDDLTFEETAMFAGCEYTHSYTDICNNCGARTHDESLAVAITVSRHQDNDGSWKLSYAVDDTWHEKPLTMPTKPEEFDVFGDQ